MKIYLTSDVHVECKPVAMSAPPGTDLVVLAGDIGEGIGGIEWARQSFGDLPIVYVPGNHEYYDGDIDTTLKAMRCRARRLGVHLLDRKTITVIGVRVLGTTLWSGFGKWHANGIIAALRYANDYSYIRAERWWASNAKRRKTEQLIDIVQNVRWSAYPIGAVGDAPFHPAIAYLLHRESVRWLDAALCAHYDGPTVVATHHAPTYQSLRESWLPEMRSDPDEWNPRNEESYLAACYASDLSVLLRRHKDRIAMWMHGHIHAAVDHVDNGVRIVSNPRGYPDRIVPGKGDASGYSETRLFSVVPGTSTKGGEK